jgi:hypothetical protein
VTTGDLPPEFVPVAPELFEGDLQEPFADAGATVRIFLSALQDPKAYAVPLRRFSTPESHAAWGDFTEAAAFIARSAWTMATPGEQPVPDVTYIGLFRDTTGKSYYVVKATEVFPAATVTLVHRPSLGGWVVHAMGKRVRADDVPRD